MEVRQSAPVTLVCSNTSTKCCSVPAPPEAMIGTSTASPEARGIGRCQSQILCRPCPCSLRAIRQHQGIRPPSPIQWRGVPFFSAPMRIGIATPRHRICFHVDGYDDTLITEFLSPLTNEFWIRQQQSSKKSYPPQLVINVAFLQRYEYTTYG